MWLDGLVWAVAFDDDEIAADAGDGGGADGIVAVCDDDLVRVHPDANGNGHLRRGRGSLHACA